jgi:hypothetical protein
MRFLCVSQVRKVILCPMIILKRQKTHPALMTVAHPGSLMDCSKSVCIKSDQSVKVLKNFIDHVKPITERKDLFVVDVHSKYIKKNWRQ